MRNSITYLFVMLLTFGLLSCEKEIGTESSELEGITLKRMPYYQYSYFLDTQGSNSHVYEVDFDFQGLTGKADLSPLVYVKGGSHMTVTPSTVSDPDRRIVIVNNGGLGKVYFVPENGHPNAGENLFLAPEFGLDLRIASNNRKVNITQVDFDQDNKLFIAGKSGFFEIYYALKGDATKTPIGYEVWSANPEEHVLWAIQYDVIGNTNNDIQVENEEDAEDIAEEYVVLGRNFKHPKFMGGDILFTQNAEETDGFEKQMLISFTQWGDRAMFVEFADQKATANHLFHLRRSMPEFKKELARGKHKVTGAALVGDNLLMTSHHYSNSFSIWTLAGEEIARPEMVFPNDVPAGWKTPASGEHNWGDMASFQRFDHSLGDMSEAESRIIDGEYSDNWWPETHLKKILAEVKKYNPKAIPLSYSVNDMDNPDISTEARINSANSDIADLNKNARKFTSLGKGGTIVLKFPTPVKVTGNTKLQIVETTWFNPASFLSMEDAWSSTQEAAFIYVSSIKNKYIGAWMDEDKNWTLVGTAYIAGNTLPIPGNLDEFSWVKIVDCSNTGDGFDLNFVAAFEEE